MPIRFRCAYCNQLMGIARRKGGTVVRCPTCGGQVIVPQPHGEPAAQPAKQKQAGAVFEQADFGDVFQQPANGSSGARQKAAAVMPAPAPAPPPAAAPPPAPSPPAPLPLPAPVEAEPVYLPGPTPGAGVLVLNTAKLVLLGAILVMLLALSFMAGLLIGRTSVGG
jgi:hypothetical protein